MTTSALSQSGWPARSFSSIISLSSAAVFRDLSGIIMTIQTGRTPCLGNAARTSHCGPNQKHYARILGAQRCLDRVLENSDAFLLT